jgi:hypothetical protein
MHQCIEPLLSSNQMLALCTFGISEEDEAKVIRNLEMQVNNLDRKRKDIDIKVEQIEAVMIVED